VTEAPQIPPPMATPRISAGALFVDEHDRILLVEPAYKPYWDIPGGYVEPGESPLAACAREVREELGIEPPIGPLLVVDWAPAEKEGDKILFIFAGGTLSADQLAAIRLGENELRSYGFRDVTGAATILIPRLARRVAAALDAYRTGQTRYLEHGATPAALLPN
jgi:8-oxo-dGTP diphosphatase